jgi:hypothetical protein
MKIFSLILTYCFLISCSVECKRVWRNCFALYKIKKGNDSFYFYEAQYLSDFRDKPPLDTVNFKEFYINYWLKGIHDSTIYRDTFSKLKQQGFIISIEWNEGVSYYKNINTDEKYFNELCDRMPKNNDSCGCEIVYNNNCRP